MECEVEEVVEIAHVDLHPVERCSQVDLDALADDLEVALLDGLELALVAEHTIEQPREGLQHHVPYRQCQIGLLLLFLRTNHIDIRLHICVVFIVSNSDRVLLEVPGRFVAECLVDFPEALIVVLDHALDHPRLVLPLQLRQYLLRTAHAQGLTLLQRVDEVELEEVQTLQLQHLLVREPAVVERQTPRQVALLVPQAHQRVELHTNRHVPILFTHM